MSNNGGNLTVQYNLRWSEELRDKIAEEAKKNTRSMNQEIIARLEQSFEETKLTEDVLLESYEKLVEKLLVNVMINLESDGVAPNRIHNAVLSASKNLRSNSDKDNQ